MADLPLHRVVMVERHEWVIGNEYSDAPMIARELRDGILFAQKDMEKQGISIESDDAYYVRLDDNQIVLYVEVEVEETRSY